MELMRFEKHIPEYYMTRNLEGAQLISSDDVWPEGETGLGLNGHGTVLGLWDGAGNGWEWTRSPWDETQFVLRGGSWADDRRFARCA